jgi:hypothetical protein
LTWYLVMRREFTYKNWLIKYSLEECCALNGELNTFHASQVRGLFAKFVNWRQCAAVMQTEVVTVMPSFSGGCNVVVAWYSSL